MNLSFIIIIMNEYLFIKCYIEATIFCLTEQKKQNSQTEKYSSDWLDQLIVSVLLATDTKTQRELYSQISKHRETMSQCWINCFDRSFQRDLALTDVSSL